MCRHKKRLTHIFFTRFEFSVLGKFWSSSPKMYSICNHQKLFPASIPPLQHTAVQHLLPPFIVLHSHTHTKILEMLQWGHVGIHTTLLARRVDFSWHSINSSNIQSVVLTLIPLVIHSWFIHSFIVGELRRYTFRHGYIFKPSETSCLRIVDMAKLNTTTGSDLNLDDQSSRSSSSSVKW